MDLVAPILATGAHVRNACCAENDEFVLRMMNFAHIICQEEIGWSPISHVSNNDEFCIKYEEFCIKNHELCI